ncbi:MAG: CYTH domain-containing protein [Proteobacteria bacterium]|jgi:adenylate cyclase|nr:CYTH domain-containing protein [Pseudomonadota bacterium]
MPIEIELKLSFPADALPELMRHPLIAAAPSEREPEMLDNTYFDTPSLMLKAHGIGLRLRRQAGGVVQTVKCSAAQSINGLTRRPEWEIPWDGHFDFSAVTDEAAAVLLARVRDELVPVFTTRFSRDTRRIQSCPGARILAMIDNGLIEAGGGSVPIHELELELLEGDEDELIRLAEKLRKTLPLAFENVSKAQRGYQLVAMQQHEANPA